MNIANPDPSIPPFLAEPFRDIYNWAAGAGIGLSVIAIIVIAIALMFAKYVGGAGRLVGALVTVIAAVILILNAGTFLGLFV